MALLAFVYERTHSAMWLAVTTAARVVPIVVLGPLGGVLADRFDRRRIMIVSDLLRVALMLGLAVVAVAGLPVVLAPVFAALATAAAAPYPPCTAATTPRLVPDADLPGANAARSADRHGRGRGRAVVGAALLFLGSPATAFLVNAGTFGLSALAVVVDPGRSRVPAGSERRRNGMSVLADVVLGARALRVAPGRRPAARRRRGLQRRLRDADGPAPPALPAFGFGDAGYGYVLAGLGVGGILGTLARRACRGQRPAAGRAGRRAAAWSRGRRPSWRSRPGCRAS